MAMQPPRTAELNEIPVIDLGALTRSVGETRSTAFDQAAAAIGDVSRRAGFFYVANHGVPTATVAATFAAAARFFALPLERKMDLLFTRSPNYRGYVPIKSRGTDSSRKGNMLEAFQIMLDLPPDDPDVVAGKPLHGPNQWPVGVAGFREAVSAYESSLRRLAETLFRCFSLSLGIEREFFIERFQKPLTLLRLARYPASDGPVTEDEIGVSVHRDAGAFTILAQDNTGGLEIQLKSGEWVGARFIPETFIINIGDAMARWTNDEFTSTPHRVINYSRRERYSIPYFANVDYDVTAECLPTCTDADHPPIYPPMHTGEYILARYRSIWQPTERVG
jgi:isopenicillin N synthase-like dioxygenase